MHIMFEIETIRVRRSERPDDVIEGLFDSCRKYKFIGSGCYASVYGAKNSNIVYKVGDVDSNGGYLSFIKSLKKSNSRNPFFPKIHGVRIYTNGYKYENMFIVAMEKLVHLNAGHHDSVEWIENYMLRDKWNDPMSGATLLGVKMVIPKQLKAALDALKTICDKNRDLQVDLHYKNIMLRKNQFVITDPFC